jgi:hypothetical protein
MALLQVKHFDESFKALGNTITLSTNHSFFMKILHILISLSHVHALLIANLKPLIAKLVNKGLYSK